MSLVIDSHQHFWDQSKAQFDYTWTQGNPPLDQTYLPKTLAPFIQKTGVDRTVFIQTQHNIEENRWVLNLAEQNEFIAGVVGWVDLKGDNCEDQLLQFKDHPKFVGIRHVVQDEPDENWIVRDETIRGLKVLQKHQVPYDLLFYVQHLKHAVKLGNELPELKMVIDHISKPKIKAGPGDPSFETWKQDMTNAASFENIFCKLSGMITEADQQNWKPHDLTPYVGHAIDCFGFDRLMFGSDWPVCLLAGSYQQVYDALQLAVGNISDTDHQKLMGGTAKSFYGLPD